MGKYMDKLPTVISCCFCCFLRAGSVVIALVSFLVGVTMAPNISVGHGYWDLNGIINSSDTPVETFCQLVLGVISILLCIISAFLIIGALCSLPKLLEYYQWGAIFYSATTIMVYFTLATHCFAAHDNCMMAGVTLLVLMMLNVLLTAYFVIVVNSLRMSMVYLASSSILDI